MNARNVFLPLGLLASFLPLLGCSGGTGDPISARVTPFSTSPVAPFAHEETACVSTVAEFCSLTSCYANWSAADDACMNASSGTLQYSTTCGSGSEYYALSQGSTTSYYSASSNDLLAVVDGQGRCIAGPADFVAPVASTCPLVTCGMFSCGGPPDAGMP